MSAVALIPALDEADRIGATVRALRALDGIDRVVVVDGGSTDRTASEASAAGATVVVAPDRLGKGEALEAGLSRIDPEELVVLADADLGHTAARLDRLLDEVRSGRTDMAIAVLPPPPSGGFGLVKRLARWLIAALTGRRMLEPLSGQRVVTARCLLACRPLAPGFGTEVALTADALRLGFSVTEVPVALEHRFTRKDLAGFLHRGRQGLDALRAAAPRILRLR